MRTLLVLVVLAVLLGIGLWFLIGRSMPAPQEIAAAPAASDLPDRPVPAPALDVVPAIDARSTAPAPVQAGSSAGKPDASTAAQAEVKGRILLPGGAPASDVQIRMSGRQANQERVMKFGLPEKWEDPRTVTGGDGRFSIRLDPPRAYLFTLQAKLPGYCSTGWRWSGIEPAETKDLGEVELQVGGAIAGRVVDAKGRPLLRQDWTIYAEGGAWVRETGRETTRVQGPVDRSTGEFRLEDLLPGPAKLTANHKVANWIDGPTVEVVAGDVVRADVVYSGPDIGSRITVITSCRPFHIFNRQVEKVVLRGPGIEPRSAVLIPRSSQHFGFEDVPPGSYTVEIDDPKFLPWSQSAVEPGTSVSAVLKGSAGVRLSVVDADGGQPLARYALKTRFDRSNTRPSLFSLLEAGAEPPQAGLFEGLIPTFQTLLVGAEGYAECRLEVADLQPGEVRSLVARLSKGSSLSGRVLQGADGSPAAGIVVVLEAYLDPNAHSFIFGADDPEPRLATSDPDGRFAFSMLPAGEYTLSASKTPLVRAEIPKLVLGESDRKERVELVLPATATLHGRLIGPAGGRLDGLALRVVPTNADEQRLSLLWMRSGDASLRTPVNADGSYRTGPLPAGAVRVSLQYPDVSLPTGPGGWTTMGSRPLELGVIDLPPGADVERDFDATGSFPGWVRIRATIDGSPAAGTIVEARGAADRMIDGGAVLDAEGRARLGPLRPNQYRLLVRAVDSSWTWISPDTFAARCCDEPSYAFDVTLVEGVLIVRAEGPAAPITSGTVLIRQESEMYLPEVRCGPDAEGRLRLKLPPGRYTVRTAGSPERSGGGPRVPFDWTSAGPVPAEIVLPSGG